MRGTSTVTTKPARGRRQKQPSAPITDLYQRYFQPCPSPEMKQYGEYYRFEQLSFLQVVPTTTTYGIA